MRLIFLKQLHRLLSVPSVYDCVIILQYSLEKLEIAGVIFSDKYRQLIFLNLYLLKMTSSLTGFSGAL